MALTATHFSDPMMRAALDTARGSKPTETAAGTFGALLEAHAAAVETKGAPDIVTGEPAIDTMQASVTRMNTYLLGLQEAAATGEGTGMETYNFRDMSRGEIADVGKKLFNEGKISIDELFRFEHPDGRLKIGMNGEPVDLSPYDRIDFTGFMAKAVRDMEATGEALRPDSGYTMFTELLAKLQAWQA